MSGVLGCAELTFSRRGARTVLGASRIAAPLAMIRPFELRDGRLVVQLLSLGPGLCGGDAIEIRIHAAAGAQVIVTTTSATRVLAMAAGAHARQDVHLVADAGATLEYYPRLTIPFPGSSYSQVVSVLADPTAQIGVIECWAMGRVARDEYLAFESLSSRTSLTVGESLLYTDALQLTPAAVPLAGAGVLAGRRYAAAGFWHGVTLPGEAEAAPCRNGSLSAIAQSRPGLAYLRALGDDGPEMDRLLQRSVERVARAWSLEAVSLDRFQG